MTAAATQAYEEGRGARRAGKARRDNPFPSGDAKHEAWLSGYRDQKALDYTTAYSTIQQPRTAQ